MVELLASSHNSNLCTVYAFAASMKVHVLPQVEHVDKTIKRRGVRICTAATIGLFTISYQSGSHAMQYVYLIIAICAETVATTALKMSEAFTRLVPSIVVVIGYSVSFYLLSLCLKSMKVGVVYALWSGLGIVLITIIGIFYFKQRLDVAGILGMGLIVAGVIVLNVFSNVQAH